MVLIIEKSALKSSRFKCNLLELIILTKKKKKIEAEDKTMVYNLMTFRNFYIKKIYSCLISFLIYPSMLREETS